MIWREKKKKKSSGITGFLTGRFILGDIDSSGEGAPLGKVFVTGRLRDLGTDDADLETGNLFVGNTSIVHLKKICSNDQLHHGHLGSSKGGKNQKKRDTLKKKGGKKGEKRGEITLVTLQ